MNNNWQLESGDVLEKRFCDELRQLIPAYEKNWAVFIGNDGHNQMAQIPNFPKEKEIYRLSFSEHHYTIAESILCINQVILDIIPISKNYTGTNILVFQNLFISFFAHVGRVFDNVKMCTWDVGKLLGILKEESSKNQENEKNPLVEKHMKNLSEYYYQRHIVIHGKKVPIGFSSQGDVLMPILRVEKDSHEGWDKSLSWKDFEGEIGGSIETLQKTFVEFRIEVNNVLNSLHDELMKYLKQNNFHLVSPSNQVPVVIDVYGISRATDNAGTSGSSGFANKK